MPELNYKKSSPYFNTMQKGWYLDVWTAKSIPPDISDKMIEITSEYVERPDKLAAELYGSEDYWYIFMLRNRDLIDHPIYDLKAGLKIMIPSKERVSKL